MTPPELFLAGLGSCAAYYAAQFLLARKLADDGVEVSVTAEKLKDPVRLGKFRIEVRSPIALTDDQALGLERSVHRCLIHQTLLGKPEIEIIIGSSSNNRGPSEPALVNSGLGRTA